MRIALGVEYSGHEFYGFQFQAQSPTVQECLEEAASQVADERIQIHGAGRTDAGVSATGQVCHFETSAKRSTRSWVLGINTHLPPGAVVQWAKFVPTEFHSRFSAQSRAYRYVISNRPVRPAVGRHGVTWIREALDADKMNEAALYLLGEHDFTAFRARKCQANNAIRKISSISVTRSANRITLAIQGNAFLHHMVRNIVGSLLEVGTGERSPDWIREVLEGRDRTLAGVTAPADGLCLTRVQYPSRFEIPDAYQS